jgi:hypothetical protein
MIYTMVEYFFDGSGVEDPSRYDYSLISRGIRATLGQQYLYASLSTMPTPFDVFRPSISGLVNIKDYGFILIPQLNVAPYENTDVSIGSNLFLGPEDCEFVNQLPFHYNIYIWLKVYF